MFIYNSQPTNKKKKDDCLLLCDQIINHRFLFEKDDEKQKTSRRDIKIERHDGSRSHTTWQLPILSFEWTRAFKTKQNICVN